MIFPPQLLNNRISAHYIEINQIFMVEMFKKYLKVKKQIAVDREMSTQKEKMTKYITNPNYIFEPLGEDAVALRISRL